VKVTVSVKEPTKFTLLVRAPEWADEFVLGDGDEPREEETTPDGTEGPEVAEVPADSGSDEAGSDEMGGDESGDDDDESADDGDGDGDMTAVETDVSSNAVNDEPPNGYEAVTREWRDGDSIAFDLHASVRRLAADPRAENLRGQVALQYGPFIYCVEQCDYPEPIDRLFLPENARLDARDYGNYRVLRGVAGTVDLFGWPGGLYAVAPTSGAVSFRAIPYYAWDERRQGAMKVWLPTAPPTAVVRGIEGDATVAASFEPENSVAAAVADPIEPSRSKDHPARLCHFWPHLGGGESITYVWPRPQRISSSRVYWFDDTGLGHCRLPKSARLLWRDGNEWKPVGGDLPVAADRWCEAEFPAVTTKELRLEIEQRDPFASGVLEWNVFGE
jgi:hypothetical protein